MSVKQENTLLRILRNHSLRGSGEILDLINYKLHGTNLLFGTICCIGNNHFFQGYTSMLECAAVIVDKLIVITGIDEVIIVFCEDKGRAHMKFRQLCFVWIFDDENIPIYVIEVSALLVAQIRIRIPVADDFRWFFNTNSPMIGGHDDTNLALSEPF